MHAVELMEVIIGLVFVVLLVSIIIALVNEIIVTNIKMRSKMLKKAIKRLLDDPGTHDEVLGDKFYNHPLINKLSTKVNSNPSYISPSTFSKVIVDVLSDEGITKDLDEAIKRLPEDSETRAALLALYYDAQRDINKFKLNIEQWFDESMRRLTGWYKRYTQVQLFILGLLAAVIMNVDLVHIAKELSDNKETRIAMVESARDYVRSKQDHASAENRAFIDIIEKDRLRFTEIKLTSPEAILDSSSIDSMSTVISGNEKSIEHYQAQIKGYEGELKNIKSQVNEFSGLVGIFWEGKVTNPKSLFKAVKNAPYSAYLGWLITALATSLGSAFWFDLLKKLINIRGSAKAESTVKN